MKILRLLMCPSQLHQQRPCHKALWYSPWYQLQR